MPRARWSPPASASASCRERATTAYIRSLSPRRRAATDTWAQRQLFLCVARECAAAFGTRNCSSSICAAADRPIDRSSTHDAKTTDDTQPAHAPAHAHGSQFRRCARGARRRRSNARSTSCGPTTASSITAAASRSRADLRPRCAAHDRNRLRRGRGAARVRTVRIRRSTASASKCIGPASAICCWARKLRGSRICASSVTMQSKCCSISSSPRSISLVHIFFPDPWPKKRHHKRRLIQPAFVALLARVLERDGIAAPCDGLGALRTAHARSARCDRRIRERRRRCRLRAALDERPLTRFERRGQRLGHGVWDLEYRDAELRIDRMSRCAVANSR